MKPFDKFVTFNIDTPRNAEDTGFAAWANDSASLPMVAGMLETAFRNMPIGDPSAMQWTRQGFAVPNPHAEKIPVTDEVLGVIADVPLVHMDPDEKFIWFVHEERARMLSPATIKDALAIKLEEWVEKTGEEPTKRERNDMRDEIVNDLLPKAVIKRTKTHVLITPGRLIVFAGSQNIGEKVSSAIRKAIGSLPAYPFFEAPDFITVFLKKVATEDYDTETLIGAARSNFELVGNAKLNLESGDYSFKGVEDITRDEAFVKALSLSDGFMPYGLIEGYLFLDSGVADHKIGFTLNKKGTVKSVSWIGEDVEEFEAGDYETGEEREAALLGFLVWNGYQTSKIILDSLHMAYANRVNDDEWSSTSYEEDDM